MTIYEKIQTARVELQSMKLKKSGQNTYSKFSYYELSDLLPAINVLCSKHGLFTKFDITVKKGVEMATLTIVEESEVKVVFSAPTAEVEIGKSKTGGGAQPIQNLGGKITYMRRYMLMTAFEIVENDMVDTINQTLNSELSAEDKKKIADTKDFKTLTKVCGELKQTYKATLIKPLYDTRKEELENKVIKKPKA